MGLIRIHVLIENQKNLAARSIVRRTNTRGAINLLAVFLMLLIAVATSPLSLADDGPVIRLDGDETDYTTNFIENTAAPKVIVSENLVITNTPNRITGATVKITNANRPDSAVESLGIAASVSGLTVKYSAATGELTITGTATIEKYTQALSSLTYFNTSDDPDKADRIITVTVRDGANISPPATITLTITRVNDAPELNPNCVMTLASINEDSPPTSGRQVSDIISSGEQGGTRDCITDKDKGDPEGIAVIGVLSSNGVWQYSTDGGNNWQEFGAVSDTSAVVLDGTARIRFLPNPNFHGSSSFSFRAWDQSEGRLSGTTGVNTSLNGGTTPFSAVSGVVTIQILSVNDRPFVDLNGSEPGLDYNTQFFENGSPVPIADYRATITDADHDTLQKLTITLTTRPDGSAESLIVDKTQTGAITIEGYNPANGQLVLIGPAPHATFAQVLRSVTYANTDETPTTSDRIVTVVANDGVEDGPAATTTIAIRPPNNAPILDSAAILTLGNIVEDTVEPPGAQISNILAAAGDPITDPDSGALEGIAVIGVDAANGQWQYSTVNPPESGSWLPIANVTPATALLLSDSAWLRFVPAADYHGPAGPLTFRAWDRTFGGNGQPNINTTVNGGNTAFSVNTNTITAQVTPVNDAPLLAGLPIEPLLYVEDSPPLVLAGQLTLTDPDSPTLASATVRLTNPVDGNAEWLVVNTEGTGISSTYSGGVLQLTGAASPQAYQQALRTVAYRNTSLDPDAADRIIEWAVSDGQASRPPVSMIVRVQPVNNPPELDLDGIGPNLDYATVFYINRGPVSIVAQSLVLIEHDNTTIQSATIRITNLKDGSAEILAATPGGTGNITSTYDPATGVLSLTGVDSVANYQRVLRTVTYDNNRSNPDTEKRIIEFNVADTTSVSETRRSTVSLVVAPTVYHYMPLTAWAYRRAEEPNNTCSQAMELYLNTIETFGATDKYDWFYFNLPSAADLTVELHDFLPRNGQMQVFAEKVAGQGCGVNSANLEQIGFNGDPDNPTKIITLGRRPPGRYYVWVINDDPNLIPSNYRLFIRAQ